MNMNLIRVTAKWELRKWWNMLAWVLGIVAMAWAILAFLPIPQEYWQGFWYGTLEMIVPGALILAGTFVVFLGVLMILVYPFLMSFCDLHKATLMEHQAARPYACKLYIRLVLNVSTYLMGMGVLWGTMLLLQRFEAWVDRNWFSNMVANSPAFLLPMLSLFALGAPLLLLVCAKFFDAAMSGRNKEDWMDIAGWLAAFALVGLYMLTDYIFESLSFAAALAVIITVSLTLTILSVLLISRYIDQTSEVAA